MAKNKIIYNNQVLIDLTSDTIEPSDVINSKKFHGKDGEIKTGTCTYDADTSTATAVASHILDGDTAFGQGEELVGTMPNKGSFNQTISTKNQEVSIPQGYHDGGGKISIAASEIAKITAGNIRNGVTILGQLGELEPSSDITAQPKEITPSGSWTEAQVIIPDDGYDYLSQVTINKIPYAEAPNSAGGVTVTIG